MDFRKIFDSSVPPEMFDRWRTRYCRECFEDVVGHAKLGPGKTALEIGPGTGQATEPIIKTGCSYLAIELGENFTEAMKKRFGSYDNFEIVNADFETYDFGENQFDLVYSAATIQWIPEEIGFPKVFKLLKSGGTFAMMATGTDYEYANEDLWPEIQKVNDLYFHPETEYTCSLDVRNVENHGFTNFECRRYYKTRILNADEYVLWTSIMAPNLTLQEPYKSKFYEGIRNAVLRFGNRIILNDTIILHLARKP
jgi:cyclopropane fatty-acyl-phospholipid synthase-like methyltransferase